MNINWLKLYLDISSLLRIAHKQFYNENFSQTNNLELSIYLNFLSTGNEQCERGYRRPIGVIVF